MKDKKMTELERIQEYDSLMKILYDVLENPIDNPAQKHRQLNVLYNICKYQEAIKFIEVNHPDYYYKEYDLSLPKEEIETLSQDDLIYWQLEVALVRGSLSGIKKEIAD